MTRDDQTAGHVGALDCRVSAYQIRLERYCTSIPLREAGPTVTCFTPLSNQTGQDPNPIINSNQLELIVLPRTQFGRTRMRTRTSAVYNVPQFKPAGLSRPSGT